MIEREAVLAMPPGLRSEAREPQVAVGNSGNVYVAFGASDTVYCAASRDAGRTYAPPVQVGSAGVLALGMRRGPRIAVAGRSVVLSAVYGRQGRGRDGDIRAWRSRDGGRSWQGPATVNDVPGAAREGLHAMAAAPDGTLACVWLDLRNRGTEIRAAVSPDGGATWGPNRLVYRSPDGTVCECCHPSVAYDPRGRLLVMWRNWLNGARDMYLARSDDGGRTFGPARKLGAGTWPLGACPMDGGALSVSVGGSVSTFWRRGGEMFLCAPGDPERRIGAGQQGWVAAGSGAPYLVWLLRRPGPLLVLSPGGRGPVQITPEADDPVIAAAPGGRGPVVAVWKDGSGIRAAVLSDRPTD